MAPMEEGGGTSSLSAVSRDVAADFRELVRRAATLPKDRDSQRLAKDELAWYAKSAEVQKKFDTNDQRRRLFNTANILVILWVVFIAVIVLLDGFFRNFKHADGNPVFLVDYKVLIALIGGATASAFSLSQIVARSIFPAKAAHKDD